MSREEPHFVEGIYLTDGFDVAKYFAERDIENPSEHRVIYEVEHIPKKCKVSDDPEIDEIISEINRPTLRSIVLTKCRCVKPSRKCELRSFKDEKCEWVKV